MAKERTCFQLSFLIFLSLFSKFVSLEATKPSPNSSISNAAGCVELERKALLRFKQELAGFKFSCLSGKISLSLLELKYLNHLDLSWNDFQGKTIPEYIGSLNLRRNFPDSLPTTNLTALRIFRLGYNNFSNFLPRWLSNISTLEVLDLSISRMKGPIDHISWRKLCKLQPLYLSNNDISGEIVDLVAGLSGCGNASLEALQLVGNKLSGQIPDSIGHFKHLRSLYLQSNSFSGSIPSSIGSLNDLETLDLSSNAISGTIPDSIGQLSKDGLQAPSFYEQDPPDFTVSYRQSMDLIVKGRQLEYNLTLGIVNVLDLSSNNLKGEIPEEIINLTYLGTLNLSWNQLTGKIPDKIGSLQRLETLDLSNNHLSEFKDDEVEDGDDGEMLWFYIGMAAGFSLGFWVVCGTLIMKKSWKRAYFQFVDETKDKIFVAIAVCVARLRR
uniref:Leucine-rich repeat-containing N-terminal plant-type domain-containing protein n=1 Tax=Populus trichocarpa TaxID=3694 RepID=A0A2K1YPM3_POPTR